MDPALETLLDGVIDYAGLFPPARLDMADAVGEYLDLLAQPESLLVNRFVCPAGRLAELAEALESEDDAIQFGVSVVGTGISAIADDLAAMEEFDRKLGDRASIEGFEVRSEPDVAASLRALRPLSALDVYLEIPLDDATNEALHLIAESELASAKARTGGLEAAAFPTPNALASFMRECLDLNLSFKLTAGLHHPIRQQDPATGAMMHGFLNVLIALALAEEHDLTRGEIARILDDDNPRNFVVNANEIGHLELRADLGAIDGARTLFAGFGSCSVSEPVEDLRALGLW